MTDAAPTASATPEKSSKLHAAARDAGEWLFKEGEPSREMYVLLSGGLEVFAGDRKLDEVIANETIGEVGALMGEVARQAVGVRAARPSRLLRMA